MSNTIYLIGFMACGKSTAGKLFAEKINASFLDTDEIIEKEQQAEIMKIFEEYGEKYFRKLEEKLLLKILKNKGKTVVATGGGMPFFKNNMEKMLQHGKVVYLKCSPNVIAERVSKNTKRPLLEVNNNLLKNICELLDKREVVYNRANIILDVSRLNEFEVSSQLTNLYLKGDLSRTSN